MTDTTMDGEASVGDVLDRLMGDFAAASGTLLTAIGHRLGLWDALAVGSASAELAAERAGVAVPYMREWLRCQTAARYVEYDADNGTFSMSPAVTAVFTGELSGLPAGLAAQLRAYWAEFERYEEAFRTGGGITWGELPKSHADGMDLITRAVVVPAFVSDWLPAIGGIVSKLTTGAKVADIGCGYGAPTIAMAKAFPLSTFMGFDVDDASVGRARKAAVDSGVGDRVSFEVVAATDVGCGPYDLVTFIDVLHDLGDARAALQRVRAVLADDGVVLLVEHAGSDRLEQNLDPVCRFFYAASVLVCTPNALAEHGSPLGCLPGERTLRRVAAGAGFTRVRRLEVNAPLNLLLELRP